MEFLAHFMSLIGLEFFRQIVVEKEILQPARILNEMNHYFDMVFGNLEELSLKDGIDLAFCAYDYENRTLEYAGAFNPLYIIRNNEILEVKGDRIIVGPEIGIQRGSFQNKSVKLEEMMCSICFRTDIRTNLADRKGRSLNTGVSDIC